MSGMVDVATDASFIEPQTDEIELGGTLLGDFEGIQARLSKLQLFYMRAAKDNIVLLRVERRDIQKRPFLFFIITFTKDKVNLKYTVALDSSPKIRRLYVMKMLLSVLSLITDLYRVDNTGLFQHLDSAVDDVLNSLSQSYSTLFNNYDSLFNEYRELKRLNIELMAANKNLTVQATQLTNENKETKDRLATLEAYSDQSLMVMVEEWLEGHASTIDINEFANTYKISPTRLEQILDKMVALGYIELKG